MYIHGWTDPIKNVCDSIQHDRQCNVYNKEIIGKVC